MPYYTAPAVFLLVTGVTKALMVLYQACRGNERNPNPERQNPRQADNRNIIERVTVYSEGNPSNKILFNVLLRLSEEKFVAGNINGGASFLAKAIALCTIRHQDRWDQVLDQILKPELYTMVSEALEEALYSNVIRSIRRFPIEE